MVLTVLLTVACSEGKSDAGGASGQPSETASPTSVSGGTPEQAGETVTPTSRTGGTSGQVGETVAPAGDSEGGQGQPRQYKWHETLDEVWNGVRLVLSYPGWADGFIGRVENTTDKTLTNVRVVITTSDGYTLVTDDLTDLASGEIKAVQHNLGIWDPFGTWTAYPEVDVDPAVAEAQEEITWDPESATKARRPPIQAFVELLDIRLDWSNFAGADVLEACRYAAGTEGSDNRGETAPKSIESVRYAAADVLYRDGAGGALAYAEIDPLPGPDDPNRYDEEFMAQWNERFDTWLTPQVDELLDLFCPEVFARHERGVNVIGQLPHPSELTGAPPRQPLTQEDVKKFYRSLPQSERSDPAIFSDRCGLFRKHNWDIAAVRDELSDGPGLAYLSWWISWWFELAGFVVKTPEWEEWVLQEYDLPQDRRRWNRLDEWTTYWAASEPLEKQLIQMFCEEY